MPADPRTPYQRGHRDGLLSHDDAAFVGSIASHIAVLRVREPTEDRPDVVTVERLAQEDGGYRWAVRCRSSVLGKSGKWEWEPSPSNRRRDHARRFRWSSLAKAWAAAVRAQAEADREWAAHVAKVEARRAAVRMAEAMPEDPEP